jgi:NADPH2:quinone reductase
MPALARGGTVVKCGILGKVWKWTVGPGIVPAMRKLTTFTTLDEDYEEAERVLADAIEKVKSGVYKKENFLDSVFDLQDVGLAHQHMEDCEATGKKLKKLARISSIRPDYLCRERKEVERDRKC